MLIAIVLAAAVASAPPNYDFRGAALGMGLGEWRAMPLPPQLMGPAQPICTDKDPLGLWAGLSEAEKASGLVRCIYGVYDFAANGMVVRTNMRIGDSEITGATYDFFNNKLLSIELVAELSAFAGVKAALEDRFGKAAEDGPGDVQNGLGLAIPAKVLKWRAGSLSILVQAPGLRVDRMTVEYLDETAKAQLDRAKEAVHPGANKF